jgi:hypothetical protein
MSFDYALSLGPTCRARYQMERVLGKERCPSGVFDWQITGRKALVAYLRNDFEGMYELADLEIDGMVCNRRFGTTHQHEFPPDITLASLPAHYVNARSRHDHLAAKTRALLRGDKRLLLCLGGRLTMRRYVALWLELRLRFPRLTFTLLNGPRFDDPDEVATWYGNDAAWDGHLRRFATTGPVSAAGTQIAAPALRR